MPKLKLTHAEGIFMGVMVDTDEIKSPSPLRA